MRQNIDASAESLIPFIKDSVQPGSTIHTDGWLGYAPLDPNGYQHKVTFLKGKKKTPSALMPRVHRVIKRVPAQVGGRKRGDHTPLNRRYEWAAKYSGACTKSS
jgi:hypothetical protein